MKIKILHKYKRCLIFVFVLGFFLIKNTSFAQSISSQCSKDGYTVLTINGVLTDDNGAQKNRDKLKYYLGDVFNNQTITVNYLLNPSHAGGALDLPDAIAQGDFDEKSDYDLTNMLLDASEKINTQKVLIVGHSQGNFYANNFYDKVTTQTYGIPRESIGVYAVATPADHIAGINNPGRANYMNSSTDNVIYGLSGSVFQRRLLATTTIDEVKSLINPIAGHDFIDVYLKYRPTEIVAGIQNSLNKLQTNNIQNTKVPCMNAPTLDNAYINTGAVLSLLDHPFNSVQTGFDIVINKVGSSLYNASLALGNSVISAVNMTASAISSLASSITNNNSKNVALNNTASVIDAVSASDAPQNTSPELTTPPQKSFKPDVQAPEPKVVMTVQYDDSQNTPTQTLPIALPPVSSASSLSSSTQNNATAETVSTISNTVTTQNLYPNLLPGGGGVAASDVPANIVLPVVPPVDSTPPVITILGDNPAVVVLNSAYTDVGATALDDVDGSVFVNTSGTVDTSTLGLYTLTYTATDVAGNTATTTRSVRVSSRVYIPKYTFGSQNGDGNDWEVWSFNGSNVYDWVNSYVNHYLNQQFKVQRYGNGTFHCSQCMIEGIFTRNPLQGFEANDILEMTSIDADNSQFGLDGISDVNVQWDALGYTYTVTNDSTAVIEATGHTDIANVDNNMWVGWSVSSNQFSTFPSGDWMGAPPFFIDGRMGGSNMILQPYSVLDGF